MFCQECGAKNPDSSTFCQECGAKIDIPNVTPPPLQKTQSEFTQPQQGFTQSQQGFTQSQQGFTQSQQGFTQSQQGFTQLQQGFTQPQQGFTQSQQGFTQPQQGFTQPQQGFTQSQQGFTQPQAAPAKPRKPMSILSKIAIGTIVILCIAIVSLYNIAKIECSPEKVAERYFKNVADGKWDKVYDQFDITESSAFITKENFVSIQSDQDNMDLNTFKVGKADTDDESLGTVVDITYRLKGDTENNDYSVVLSKQSKKRYFFFNTWKVSPSSFITEDFTIQVLNGATVTLGGVKIDSSYVAESDDYYTTYVVPELFWGEYDITVSKENMEDVTQTISTYDTSYYYMDSMNLKEEVTNQLVTTAQETLPKIYEAGFANSDFSVITDYFSTDETIRSDAQYYYDYFRESLNPDDGLGLQSVNLYDYSGTSYYETIEGVLYVYIELSYSYDAEYKYADWWSGEIYSDTTTNTGYTNFTYIYEDGKWVLKNTDFNVVYY